ncbi:YbjQ family protein [Halomonas sp. PR-M31]|uniref:YbjQ family protein n=1 Tax=Halomonas sp. PR-M31 TaxID=1471202 RepID=UPI000A7C7E57|nr:YbjQ family protein [Halomonas sp. PR-M31]
MSERMIVTTSSHLEGYRVTEHLDIVSAECVFGMNVFKDMFSGFRDFFGGRNKSSQNALRDARKTCLDELRKEAESLGANAVIGIDLDYSEISGDGKSMLFLVATGTAVKVVKA